MHDYLDLCKHKIMSLLLGNYKLTHVLQIMQPSVPVFDSGVTMLGRIQFICQERIRALIYLISTGDRMIEF